MVGPGLEPVEIAMATNRSATLLVPDGWTRHERDSLTELVAPEADLLNELGA